MPYKPTGAGAVFVGLTPDEMEKWLAGQCQARGVMTDAQWATAMSTLFSAANWPGVNAQSLAFVRMFFTKFIGVGRVTMGGA